MFSYILIRTLLVIFTILFFNYSYPFSVWAQGQQQTPYSSGNTVRRGVEPSLDMNPSNPLGLSRSGQPAPRGLIISPGLFQGIIPQIPNLELGYLFDFGDQVRTSRVTLDYLLPVNVGSRDTAFFEAHGIFYNFIETLSSLTRDGFNGRVDTSVGGGYRRIYNGNLMVGLNGFYENTYLGSRTYSSGSVGFEIAGNVLGNDALKFNFNYYGNIFAGSEIVNVFRKGPSNFDLDVSYTFPVFRTAHDLRLNCDWYRFSTGSRWDGWKAGAELTTPNGAFSVKYEAGHDKLSGSYQTIGANVNLAFELGNVLVGQNPFVQLGSVNRSPLTLWQLLNAPATKTRSSHPPAMMVARSSMTGPQGPAGPQGPQGLQGPAGPQGPAAPTATLILTGIEVVKNTTGRIFTPSIGTNSWTLRGSAIGGSLALIFYFDVSDGRNMLWAHGAVSAGGSFYQGAHWGGPYTEGGPVRAPEVGESQLYKNGTSFSTQQWGGSFYITNVLTPGPSGPGYTSWYPYDAQIVPSDGNIEPLEIKGYVYY